MDTILAGVNWREVLAHHVYQGPEVWFRRPSMITPPGVILDPTLFLAWKLLGSHDLGSSPECDVFGDD